MTDLRPEAKTYAPPRGARVRASESLGRNGGGKPADEYLEAAVNTATREQLLMMLLDGAVRFATRGLDALKAGKPGGDSLPRAQNIVAELLASLRPAIGKALYEKLAGLYRFCIDRLLRAAMQHEAASAEEALRVLNELRVMWADAVAKMNEKGKPEELSAPHARHRLDNQA